MQRVVNKSVVNRNKWSLDFDNDGDEMSPSLRRELVVGIFAQCHLIIQEFP